MLRSLAAALAMLSSLIVSAAAQEATQRSECLAMANAPRAVPAAFREAAAPPNEVEITYAGHSTYYIDTPGGVRIATDYSGAYRIGRLPDVVTMNRAHSTHYTLFPDSRIPHVLHGWGENGEPARIAERIGDVFIRNVTTDIRRYFGDDSSGEMIKDGNSIFIFEVAGLCIGHLGHLHHKLDDSHFAAIGRLDIVMVPIDGTYTMSLDGISDITQAAARLGGAADASLHDAARRVHAPHRPAVRDRPSRRADAEYLARDLAHDTDRDHSRRCMNVSALMALSRRRCRYPQGPGEIGDLRRVSGGGDIPCRDRAGGARGFANDVLHLRKGRFAACPAEGAEERDRGKPGLVRGQIGSNR